MQIATTLIERGYRPKRRNRTIAWLASALLLLAAAGPVGADTLASIKETGKLKIGYRTDARPFSYRDDSGKASGYSIELCQKVVDSIKAQPGYASLQVEFIALGSNDRFEAVKAGKVDLLCGSATITLERRKDVAFSIPIFPGGVGALLRKDAPNRMREILEDRPEPQRPRWRASLGQILEKRNFAVVSDTTTEHWLNESIEEMKIIATVDPVKDYTVGVEHVVFRRADVLFGDRAILMASATSSSSADDLRVLDRHFTVEPMALALARGEEDFRLLIDRTLSGLMASGEIVQIYEPYFGKMDKNAKSFFKSSAIPE